MLLQTFLLKHLARTMKKAGPQFEMVVVADHPSHHHVTERQHRQVKNETKEPQPPCLAVVKLIDAETQFALILAAHNRNRPPLHADAPPTAPTPPPHHDPALLPGPLLGEDELPAGKVPARLR